MRTAFPSGKLIFSHHNTSNTNIYYKSISSAPLLSTSISEHHFQTHNIFLYNTPPTNHTTAKMVNTYNPPAMPQRPKSSSGPAMLVYRAECLYYRYQVDFGLYVMSPGEKLVVNTFVLVMLSLIAYFFLPFIFATIPRSVIKQLSPPQAIYRNTTPSLPHIIDASLVARSTNEGSF